LHRISNRESVLSLPGVVFMMFSAYAWFLEGPNHKCGSKCESESEQ